MRNLSFAVVGALTALVFIAGCGDGADCRHKSMECAKGFSCEQEGAGWQCVKAKEPAPKESGEPAEVAAPRPEPAANHPGNFARGPKVETVDCRAHPRCSKKALACECDEHGHLQAQVLDKDGDGKGDEKALYQYNQNGELTFVVVDEGMDGVDDLRHEYGYRKPGLPMFWEVKRSPASPGKRPDSRLSYVYDEDGNLVREEYDTGIDGTVDRVCAFAPPCPPPIPNPSCKPECKENKVAR